MHKRCFVVLVLVAISMVTSFTDATINIQTQSFRGEYKNSKEKNSRHLKAMSDEERGKIEFTKMISVLKKPPNYSKAKTLQTTKTDISKIEISPGQKIDLTQMKTNSRRKVDLLKTFSKSRIFTRTASDSDIMKFKKMAEKDPDLRSISSVVGKNPTQFSAKQVEGVQAFLKHDPTRFFKFLKWGILGTIGLVFLVILALAVGGSVLVVT
ncbi:RxLR effector protein, partial [Phytophthora megakarya]